MSRLPARLRPSRTLATSVLVPLLVLGSAGVAARAQTLADDAADHLSIEERRQEHEWVAARLAAVRPPDDEPVAPVQQEPDAPRVFATYEGVDLVEPSVEPLAIGFHQAGGVHPAMTPVGTVVANENSAGTGDVVVDDTGAEILVMPSRGRGGPATSAVDVALTQGAEVASVVTGTVTSVSPYALYGKYQDVLIEVAPTGRPDLRVMIYHLQDLRVEVGDEVVAGVTPIAGSARSIPVANQVDRYAGDCPCPHIDIRIRQV